MAHRVCSVAKGDREADPVPVGVVAFEGGRVQTTVPLRRPQRRLCASLRPASGARCSRAPPRAARETRC
eukprot:12172954-Alexandrium_andersonii.AAC.1